MTVLVGLARRYLAARIVSVQHAADVLRVCRRAQQAQSNGRVCVEELTAWLRSELAEHPPATVARYRRVLLSVLNWASKQGLCQPVQLPPVRVPPPVPEAWTLEQLNRILAAASRWPGSVGKVLARDWWPALILTIYWTAARIGSVLAATPSDWQSPFLTLRCTKNGKAIVCRLHPQACEAIDRIYDPTASRLFFFPYRREWLFDNFRRIVKAAGLSPAGGLFHRLRRTCLTYCWLVDPAIAQRQADHSNAEVTRRHYIDPRIVSVARTAADVLPVPHYEPTPSQRLLFD